MIKSVHRTLVGGSGVDEHGDAFGEVDAFEISVCTGCAEVRLVPEKEVLLDANIACGFARNEISSRIS
jgi:hypothetical protein